MTTAHRVGRHRRCRRPATRDRGMIKRGVTGMTTAHRAGSRRSPSSADRSDPRRVQLGDREPVAAPRRRPPAPAPAPRPAPPAAAHEPVTITVGVLRPGATQEAVDALNLQISEFEAKYPWITVEPEEYNWTAPTFTAALAAGTLPDVFTIPFTDGKGLIAQHQIVEHRRARPGAPLRRQVQPERPRQRPGRRRHDLGRADRRLRHVA